METDKVKIKNLDKRVTAIEKFIEKTGPSKNGRLVHCYHISKETKKPCDNSWVTKSTADLVSCPKCGNKVRINKG